MDSNQTRVIEAAIANIEEAQVALQKETMVQVRRKDGLALQYSRPMTDVEIESIFTYLLEANRSHVVAVTCRDHIDLGINLLERLLAESNVEGRS